jgi:hypothetical protein
MSAIIPIPRCPVSVRTATMHDLPFIDRLQKMHAHMVGWMPAKQIEGKIAAGQVLAAQDGSGIPVGYVIAHDQYMKRDDVGVIYQLNVLPMRQRNLIGATLVKAAFERAAYGCHLFGLWCAQDIQANFFWESIGFLPLAFRTGSRSMQRTHIFWQRRIRENDTTTPYWFPSQTTSGAVREDRLVLPIPPNTHWRDVMPVVLPGMTVEPAPLHPRPCRAVRPCVRVRSSQRCRPREGSRSCAASRSISKDCRRERLPLSARAGFATSSVGITCPKPNRPSRSVLARRGPRTIRT